MGTTMRHIVCATSKDTKNAESHTYLCTNDDGTDDLTHDFPYTYVWSEGVSVKKGAKCLSFLNYLITNCVDFILINIISCCLIYFPLLSNMFSLWYWSPENSFSEIESDQRIPNFDFVHTCKVKYRTMKEN